MTKKRVDSKPYTSRGDLVDPSARTSHVQRLRDARAIDHRNNLVIERRQDGYASFRAIDPKKRHR